MSRPLDPRSSNGHPVWTEPGASAPRTPAVSVVLPVYNEARDIARVLDEVLQQQAPEGGFEVLVVDGGSQDATRAIVAGRCARHSNLRLLANPRRLSSAGRNIGARAASGRYVLFLDGHCAVPRRNYLVRVAELFQSTGAACLCRPQPLDQLAADGWAAWIASARHSRLGHNPGSDIFGSRPGFTDPHSAGAAYTRECILELDGYDERFDACEDVEFNHRVAAARRRAYFHPDLAVAYRPRSSLKALFRQMVRYGRGRARLMARHPNTFSWPLVATSLAPLVPLAGLAFVGWQAAAWSVILPGAAWITAVAYEGARRGRDFLPKAAIGLALMTIHAGLTCGFWRGLLEWRRYQRAMQAEVPTFRPGPPSHRS